MEISKKDFGKTSNGEQTYLYTITNKNNMQIMLTNFGATMVSIITPEIGGKRRDVLLGFDNVRGYEDTTLYLGATIGRYAGQIRDGKFEINGEEFNLHINDHGNTLHGGKDGFDKKVFDCEIFPDENKISFYYTSPDLEGGFPAELKVTSSFRLTDDNEIIITHKATSSKDTILNMTNHNYYNLNGHENSSILDHTLTINADEFLELAPDCAPNGGILPVEQTPMDFREGKLIGECVESDYSQLKISEGYDHNWNISGYEKGKTSLNAIAKSGDERVELAVKSDLPGLQMYSGNYLNGAEVGKNNIRYNLRQGFCLEPQYYPCSTSYKHFPSVALDKNDEYHHTIKLCFTFK